MAPRQASALATASTVNQGRELDQLGGSIRSCANGKFMSLAFTAKDTGTAKAAPARDSDIPF